MGANTPSPEPCGQGEATSILCGQHGPCLSEVHSRQRRGPQGRGGPSLCCPATSELSSTRFTADVPKPLQRACGAVAAVRAGGHGSPS